MNKLLLIICCFFLMAQVNASNINFLKYSVISDFTEADIANLEEAYNYVLSNTKLGDSYAWSNSETENGGEITVIRKYKEDIKPCRRLKFKNHSKHQSGVSYFNFCLVNDKWVVVN